MNRRASIVYVALFLAWLGLVASQQALRLVPERPLVEKRALAALPRLSWAQIADGTLFQSLLGCYDDHAGFRATLIRANNQWLRSLLHTSSNDKVIIGKAGWLFYSETVADFLKEDGFATQWEATLVANLCQLRDDLATRGVDFLLIIIPNKNTIYPEYMPDRFPRRPGPQTYERVRDGLRARGVWVIDLRPILLQHKAGGRLLYLPHDTHWNTFGSALGEREVVRQLCAHYHLPDLVQRRVIARQVAILPDLTAMIEGLTDAPRREEVCRLLPPVGRRLPPTLWYGDSFTMGRFASFIGPCFDSVTFLDFGTQPMPGNLEANLAGKRLLVLATAERNIRNALSSYAFPRCAQ